MGAVAPSSPLVGPADQAGMLQDINDRLKALEQTAILPVGLCAYCAGPVPNGWLVLDGSTIDAARYGQLAAYLSGTTLPNVTGRVVVGKAAAGTFATLLSTGGAETVTLTAAQSGVPAHTHPGGTTGGPSVASTGAGTSHTHPASPNFALTDFIAQVAAGGAFAAVNAQSGTTGAEAAHTHSMQAHTHTTPTVAANTGASAASSHPNVPPYIVLVPIIKF